MGMNTSSSQDDDVILDVNMTPLIDVMLVLLIMFIITIPKPNDAINLNLPNGSHVLQTQDKPPTVINLKLDQAGQLFWNDRPVSDRLALKKLFDQVALQSEQDEIKFNPDAQAEYKYIAMVMAMAQQSKVKKIGMVSQY